MKALLATLVLFGTSAFACPDLTGTFACTQEGQTSVIQVSQQVTNGVTVYTVKDPSNPTNQGDSLPADNNTYRLPDSAEFRNATIRGWCEGDAFKMEQTGQYFDQGQHIGDLQAIAAMSIVNGNLQQAVQGTFKTGSGDYPFDDMITCVRQ